MQPNFASRTLFHADNLPVLRGMNSETVDLIATDPPFNKGRDFHATPDSLSRGARFQDRWSWSDDVQGEWVDAIKDDFPAVWSVIEFTRQSYGGDMGAFLCFIGVRLMEMRRVLKPTGSLYLHCDTTASHYLKALCDAVFGPGGFRNEIVWKRSGGKSDAKRYGRVADRLLYYTKSGEFTWNQQYQALDPEYVRKTYSRNDNDGRGAYTTMPLHAAGVTKGGDSGEPWRGIDPGAKGRHWGTPVKGVMSEYIIENGLIPGWPRAYPAVRDRLDALDEAGLVVHGGGLPRLKSYLAASKGVAATDLITEIPMASGNERVGYPTQKPLALYERIIRASSNPGDMVLDPFCGCATTPIAAERLGRRWVGIDIWEGAHRMILRRLRSEGLATPQGDYCDDEQTNLLSEGDVRLETRPPQRTDDGDADAPTLMPTIRFRPAIERWQKLSHDEMRAELESAQSWRSPDLVICAGCGRGLEPPFMELDHINPRAQGGENWITNRILLCRPCNGRKRHELTLIGLHNENKRDGWMKDARAADESRQRAQIRAGLVRDNNGATAD